jgi:hypothetical protein
MANERAVELMGTTFTIGTLTLNLKSIQPIGVDGGDPIDVTLLSNTAWVTKQPQTLKEVPDFTFTCQYFPDDLTKAIAQVNQNQALAITAIGAGFSLNFWGYLRTWEPREAGKGEEATATGTVVVTNMDNDGVEQPPSVS